MQNSNDVLISFGERLVVEIKSALQNKNLTGHGASVATGNLLSSIRYEVKENELLILGNSYIEYLEYGRRKTVNGNDGGRTVKERIREWIDVKGITPDDGISKDSLAFLIARKIHEEGTLIYRKNQGESSGLLADAINDELINDMEEALLYAFSTAVKSEILRKVPTAMLTKTQAA